MNGLTRVAGFLSWQYWTAPALWVANYQLEVLAQMRVADLIGILLEQHVPRCLARYCLNSALQRPQQLLHRLAPHGQFRPVAGIHLFPNQWLDWPGCLSLASVAN